MIKNYLRVALRSLLKNKSYVIINTLGLGVALACCITAYLLLAFNIEFNNFHESEKVANIFCIHTLSKDKEGKVVRDDQAPIVMLPFAVDEIAGIEAYTRYMSRGGALHYGDKAFNENITYVDSTFFEFFDYPLVAGSHKSFKEKNSIFLNEELAKKYFGDEDPVGKLMVLNGDTEKQVEVLVGGVIKKYLVNNSFTFSAVMRIENFIEPTGIAIDDWGDWRNPSTYVRLTSPENAEQVGKSLGKYIPTRNKARTDMVVESYELVPFKKTFNEDDIHYSWSRHQLSVVPLVIFTSMAGLILLIACFNLTNTSIAITGKRLKEVGVRKAVGALRGQIVVQFLFEIVLTITLSLFVGLLMAQFIVPAFTELWRLPYGLRDLNGVNLFIALVIMIFLAAILAGMYPALSSSKLKPTMLLKGGAKVKGTNTLTRTLVALQFALSVIVLIAGVIFIQNTRFQDNIKFGYDKDEIVTVNIQSERDYEIIKNAIAGNPKIISIGSSGGNIGSNNYQTPIQLDTTKYDVQATDVGTNYFETMGLDMVEGRAFNHDNASDVEEAVIVNKAFLKKTGLVNAIDEVIVLHDHKRRIIGVVEDHIDNLFRSKEIEPFVFYPSEKGKRSLIVVKAAKSDLPEVQKYLEKTWKETFPSRPFDSQFQDELVLGNSRRTNGNLEKIFIFITILGGLLSASGIFALASLNIAKRTKEIGIRKALGATIGNIVGLLNKEFVIVLIIAGIVGSAGGYFLIDALLNEIYSYRIPIGIVPVFLCAALIFGIGIFTTSITILKAARSNPVDTLRNE